MDESVDELTRAREAIARCDWREAADRFATASATQSLSSDDLAAYSDAVWWLGRIDDSIRITTLAYRAFMAESRLVDAGKAALDLAVIYLLRDADDPLVSGWLEKASRLAGEIPESPLLGYFTHLTEVEGKLDSIPGDVADSNESASDMLIQAARRVQQYGQRFDDPNLIASGLNGEGRALVKVGSVMDGMACLDEAMVSVLAGEVTPTFAGFLYCNTISACYEVSDIGRMVRWTELTEEWVNSMPAAVLFDGICRVHRAHILMTQGHWDRAGTEAAGVCEDLEGVSVSVVAEAWYLLAELRRLRGDRQGAEQAYGEAHRRGRNPQPGLALLRLESGDTDAAMRSISSALAAAGGDTLVRARICSAMVRIAVAAGAIEDARAAAKELADTADRYATSGLQAMAATATGAVLTEVGPDEEALAVLRNACERWNDLGAVYQVASTCLLLVDVYRSLGDSPSATLELERAQDVFDRLGAEPALSQIMARRESAAESMPGGLTKREIEVLTLVAAGQSNRRVADELFISDRTVARHLYNIFNKLGVESRTEATRYALDHGLVS